MKKRMFVCFLIFFVCLFYLLIPAVVFGQAIQVFNKYEEAFKDPDVHAFLPPVLYAFNNPKRQVFRNPVLIVRFVEKPRYIRRLYEETHDSILKLLLLDEQFRALFLDSQFHAMVQSPSEIDDLVRRIKAATPREREGPICETTQLPPTLAIVSGNGQIREPGTKLAAFVVKVHDQDGNPLANKNVTFSLTNGGDLLPASAMTDSFGFGQAQTTLTLGPNPGVYQVEASVEGVSQTQTFTATAREEPEDDQPKPTTLSIVSGDNQSGESGMSLGQAFIVGVLDQDKRPLRGIPVTFRVTEGGGQFSSQTRQMTNEYGQAEITLTLGDEGINEVNASVSGISNLQTFTATATARAEPEPVVLGQLPSVYWIEGGALCYRSTDGGKGVLLEPAELGWTLTGGLAVDMAGGRIYWTEEKGDSGRIGSANLNDKSIEYGKILKSVPYGIAVGTDQGDERWVYWTNSRGKIQRINVKDVNLNSTGKVIENLDIGNLDSPKHIAVDVSGGSLFYTATDETDNWSIWRTDLEGKNPKRLKVGLRALGGIAVVGNKLYWTEQTGKSQGKLRSAYRNGRNARTFAVLQRVPLGLAADAAGGRLYWTNAAGAILSVNLDREPIEVIVKDLNNPTGIALGIAPIASASVGSAPPSASSVRPEESVLLANYPNPFNPETWIPYQLSEPAEVSVSIYSVNGSLIRTLALGHQSAGVYRSRSRAAYWDGRNAFGERVASGLYFYTLTAGDFTATRKMLIRK